MERDFICINVTKTSNNAQIEFKRLSGKLVRDTE